MKEIDIKKLEFNPFELIGDEWLLIAAGNENKCNAMTASWGHMGAIWGRKNQHNMPTVCVYVRPSRYTKEFIDASDYFSVNVLPESLKEAHGVMGSQSGRDLDKFAATSLTPVGESGTVYVKQSKLVFICKKLYAMPLKEEFFVEKGLVDHNYPERDFHTMYIGEIVKAMTEE